MSDVILGVSSGRVIKCVHKQIEYRLQTSHIEIAANCAKVAGSHIHYAGYSLTLTDLKTRVRTNVIKRKFVGCHTVNRSSTDELEIIATAIEYKDKRFLENLRMEAAL